MEIKNKFWLVSLLVLVLSVGSVSADCGGIDCSNFNFYDDGGDTSTLDDKGNTNVSNNDALTLHHWVIVSNTPTIIKYSSDTTGGITPYSGQSIFISGDGSNDIQVEQLGRMSTNTDSCVSFYMAVSATTGTQYLSWQAAGGEFDSTWGTHNAWYPELGTTDGLVQTGIFVTPTEWHRVAYCRNTTLVYNYIYNETYGNWTPSLTDTSERGGTGMRFVASSTLSSTEVMGIDEIISWNGTILDEPVDLTPIISNQLNHTINRLNYTFSAQSDANGQCTLWYDLDGDWIQTETKSVTADQQFNFTGVGFDDYRIISFWNTNCSDGSGNEAWGTNTTFTIAKVQDSNTFDRVVFYINEVVSMIMEPFKEGWVKMTGNMYFIGDTNMTGDFTMGGNAGIGTYSPTQKLHVNDDSIRIDTANSCSGNCDQGELAWSATHLCVCTSTNTWKSVAIS